MIDDREYIQEIVNESIAKCAENGIDFKPYAEKMLASGLKDHDLSSTIFLVRDELIKGTFIEELMDFNYSVDQKIFIVECNKHGIDWKKYIERGHTDSQYYNLYWILRKGGDIEFYSSRNFPGKTMYFIFTRIQEGLPYEEYLHLDPEVLDCYEYMEENNFSIEYLRDMVTTDDELIHDILEDEFDEGRITTCGGVPEFKSLDEMEEEIKRMESNLRGKLRSWRERHEIYAELYGNKNLEVARMDIVGGK